MCPVRHTCNLPQEQDILYDSVPKRRSRWSLGYKNAGENSPAFLPLSLLRREGVALRGDVGTRTPVRMNASNSSTCVSCFFTLGLSQPASRASLVHNPSKKSRFASRSGQTGEPQPLNNAASHVRGVHEPTESLNSSELTQLERRIRQILFWHL